MESSLHSPPCNQMSGFPGSRADLFFFVCVIQYVTLSQARPGLASRRLNMLSQSFVHSHLRLTNHCVVLPFNWSCKPLRSVQKRTMGGSWCWAGASLWTSSGMCLQWPVAGLGAWVSVPVYILPSCCNKCPVCFSVRKDWLNLCMLQRRCLCRGGCLLL